MSREIERRINEKVVDLRSQFDEAFAKTDASCLDTITVPASLGLELTSEDDPLSLDVRRELLTCVRLSALLKQLRIGAAAKALMEAFNDEQ